MGKSDYLGTYNGGQFWPLEKDKTDDIDIEAIATSLSHICRFAGHTKYTYTVAQHSLMVADILRNELYDEVKSNNLNIDLAVLIGLLHDTSEAYLSDICRPIKVYLKDYLDKESVIQLRIYKAFGISEEVFNEYWPIVSKSDNLALYAEAIALMNPCDDWIRAGYDYFNNPICKKYANKIGVNNPDIIKGKMLSKIYKLVKLLNLNLDIFNKLNIDESKLDKYIPIYMLGELRYYFDESNELLLYPNLEISMSILNIRLISDISEYIKYN